MTTWDAMKETWPCPQVWAVGAEKTFHLHSVNEACWCQIPVLLVHLVQCFLISAVIHPQLVLKQGIWNQLPEIHPFATGRPSSEMSLGSWASLGFQRICCVKPYPRDPANVVDTSDIDTISAGKPEPTVSWSVIANGCLCSQHCNKLLWIQKWWPTMSRKMMFGGTKTKRIITGMGIPYLFWRKWMKSDDWLSPLVNRCVWKLGTNNSKNSH
jgi:hypothetical protein